MKVRDSEDRSRRNNLPFDGLSQIQEDWHGSVAKIKKLIKEKLGTENVKTERAYRIGKERRDETSQKRISLSLIYKDKEKVLREYRSCKL